MKTKDIAKLLNQAIHCPSKWELDNIVWIDRLTDKKVLAEFLQRIVFLESKEDKTQSEVQELVYLEELLDDMDLIDCTELLNMSDEDAKNNFVESLARMSAIETLCRGRMSPETMNVACKLSPNDFILCAKRTQDIMNAIHGLVIKGETLSKDVAGA